MPCKQTNRSNVGIRRVRGRGVETNRRSRIMVAVPMATHTHFEDKRNDYLLYTLNFLCKCELDNGNKKGISDQRIALTEKKWVRSERGEEKKCRKVFVIETKNYLLQG